jgi:hypothetical protein
VGRSDGVAFVTLTDADAVHHDTQDRSSGGDACGVGEQLGHGAADQNMK